MIKKKKIGRIIGYVCVILSPLIIFAILLQYRHFYIVGDMSFTFWKTGSGCYITPYKYTKITIPKDNYMKAANLGGAIILIGKDTTLYIFPECAHERGAGMIECNLSSYKYKYFPYINEVEYKRAIQDTIDYYINQGYPYINVYITEMSAEIGNTPYK